MERKMPELSPELRTGNPLYRDPEVQMLRRLDGSIAGASGFRNVAPRSVLGTIKRTSHGKASTGREASGADVCLSTLQARFFGHFELLCNEEPVHLGRNGKALSILKYLLSNRSRPVSQDHLMGWLWPESSLKKARWSLNSAIHGLRKLMSEHPSSASVDYIMLEEGYYRVGPTIHVATDVNEFDARYEEGRRLEKTNRTEEAATEYEKAVALYRGDYLLEDLYEDWTMVERERLSSAYTDMLWRLAIHYMQSGQPRESIRFCYRLLEVDSSHEASYRHLMHCYLSLGLREKALRHYQLCEEMLEKMYNTVPEPETKALHRSVILGEATR